MESVSFPLRLASWMKDSPQRANTSEAIGPTPKSIPRPDNSRRKSLTLSPGLERFGDSKESNMSTNTKKTSSRIAAIASDVLQDPNASGIAKRLAGSALAQSSTARQTGAEMEVVAARVLNSDKYSSTSKELAASILSQSNKER